MDYYLAYTPNITTTYNTNLAPQGFRFGNIHFDLSVYMNDTHFDHFNFTVPVTLTLTYDPALLDTLDTQTLTLLYWNGNSWANDGITVLSHDMTTQRLTVMLRRLSEFALFAQAQPAPELGQAKRLYLPFTA